MSVSGPFSLVGARIVFGASGRGQLRGLVDLLEFRRFSALANKESCKAELDACQALACD